MTDYIIHHTQSDTPAKPGYAVIRDGGLELFEQTNHSDAFPVWICTQMGRQTWLQRIEEC